MPEVQGALGKGQTFPDTRAKAFGTLAPALGLKSRGRCPTQGETAQA
jgi:hypothetical protein